MTTSVPLTPGQDAYTALKTPDRHVQTHDAKSGISPWSKRYRWVGIAVQILILASMVTYVFGPIAYFTPVYNDITPTFKHWWGVPTVQTNTGGNTATKAPAVANNTMTGNSTVAVGRGNMTASSSHGNTTMAGNTTMVGDHGNFTTTDTRGNSTVAGTRTNATIETTRGNSTSATRGNTTSVPKAPTPTPAPTTKKGHSEMVMPTYAFFFMMVPLYVSGLLMEFLRHFHLRRLTSQYVLKLALVLRRKPALFGKVSYWSYGEWLFLLGVIGGNIFVFDRYYEARIQKVRARAKNGIISFNVRIEGIGLTFGFSCLFNMAFLFLPATRNCAWMEFFNISYANGIKYHRWLGVLTVVTGVLHCVGYYWSWLRQGTWKAQSLPCFDCNLAERKGYKVWFNVFGEIALIIFLIIGFTSIPIIRRKCYNVFYYTHQLLFLAVIFSVMHFSSIVWWIFPTFLIYCYSRAVSMSSNFSPIQVQELTAISSDIVKVVLKRSSGRDGQYKVGQFLYLNVPAISKLQWHAFTIASSPRANPTTVTVLLKSLGDWTHDLVMHANECKEKTVLPTIYVDGFYGASLEMYDEYSTVLLVGGGIGATPIFAILEDLATKLASHAPVLQKVVLVFAFRELALLEELHPVLVRLKELDPHEQYFKTHFYLTRIPSDEVLTQSLDTERLAGKRIEPTTYQPTRSTPMPLTEPLRSRSYRVLAFTTVVLVGLLLLVYLEFGGGKLQRGTNRKYWPLQQLVDPAMAMVAACLVFAFVIGERLLKRKATGVSQEIDLNVFQSVGTPAFTVSDVHTYGDLLAHYQVVQGERPDLAYLMTLTYDFHTDVAIPTYGKPTIGVFVSGPEAMKRAVAYGAHAIGAHHFDIHEEEFEM